MAGILQKRAIVGVLMASVALAACGERGAKQGVEQAPVPLEPALPSFAEHLAAQYIEGLEADENWVISHLFALRADLAAQGEVVEPTDPLTREVGDKLEELVEARRALVEALELGGRTDTTRQASCARAQRYYDVWVEEASTRDRGARETLPHAKPSIDSGATREAYREAFLACQSGVVRVVEPAAPQESPPTEAKPVEVQETQEEKPLPVGEGRRWTVYFDFDSNFLGADSIRILLTIAEQAKGGSLAIVGHTDTFGAKEYNQALGLRRARAVAGVLQGMGFSTPLTVSSAGEERLAKSTPDNTREPLNRRTEITIP